MHSRLTRRLAIAILALHACLGRADKAAATPETDSATLPFVCGVWVYWRPSVPANPDDAAAYLARIFDVVVDLGMNTIVADGLPPSGYRVVLDAAHARGLRVILACQQLWPYIRGNWDDAGAGSIDDAVAEHVRQVDSHPALLMHYVYDVPKVEMVERLRDVNRLFARLAPRHRTFVAYMHDVADIALSAESPTVSWDNFPVGTSNAPGVLLNYRYDVGSPYDLELLDIRRRTQGKLHVNLVQAFDSPGRLRFPSPAEMRYQVNLSLVSGWTDGILFYRLHTRGKGDRVSHGILDADLNVRAGYARELSEICSTATRFGACLAGSTWNALDETPPRPLRWAAFEGGESRMVLIVNEDVTKPFAGPMPLPSQWRDGKSARVARVRVNAPDTILPTAPQLELPPGGGALLRLLPP